MFESSGYLKQTDFFFQENVSGSDLPTMNVFHVYRKRFALLR